MKQVILNADDFGKSPQRNQAIDDAFKHGLITSAGLIVTGQYLPEAVELAFRGGYVNHLHLHFNLSTNLLRENSNDIPLSETMRSDPFFCKNGRFLKYSGLPNRFLDIRKWRVVYQELVAQFDKFKEITQGKADYGHVDFHLWYNLTWPVSLALNLFTRRFKISSVRYYGLHQKDDRQFFFTVCSIGILVSSMSLQRILTIISQRISRLRNIRQSNCIAILTIKKEYSLMTVRHILGMKGNLLKNTSMH